mmetsp:Transcript_1492/g.1003  ORF Transcript_1492/g.1003 Transcript_1492/m.1003 type:complete len:97 (+) Transcript_1492:145-435(+)
MVFTAFLFIFYIVFSTVCFIRFIIKDGGMTKTKCGYLIITIFFVFINCYLARNCRQKGSYLTEEYVTLYCQADSEDPDLHAEEVFQGFIEAYRDAN